MPFTGTAERLVTTQIANLTTVGDAAVTQAEQLGSELVSMAKDLEQPTANFAMPSIPAYDLAEPRHIDGIPTLSSTSSITPSLPEFKTPTVSSLVTYTAPTFTSTNPQKDQLQMPDTPEISLVPPVIQPVTMPSLSIPDSPSLSTITIIPNSSIAKPVVGDVSLPTLQMPGQSLAVQLTPPTLDSLTAPDTGQVQKPTTASLINPTITLPSVPSAIPVSSSYALNLPAAPSSLSDFTSYGGTIPDAPALPTLVSPTLAPASNVLSAPSLRTKFPDALKVPTLMSVDIPVKPDLSYPPVPTFAAITVPNEPTISTISFEGTRPDTDLDSKLPAEFLFSPNNYISEIWATLVNKVENDLLTGGVGVHADVRTGMYDEMIDKQRDEHEQQYNEAQARYGAAGFALPTGALVSALSMVTLENSRQEEGFRRKTYLDQMDLAQKNTQWALDKGVDMEKILRDFFHKSEDRLLEVSKAVGQRAIDIFNAYVTKVKTEAELYKAAAIVYEARLKGEIAQVDLYKTQMEGKKIEGELQQTIVDTYVAQLGAVETKAKIFGIENENAKIQAEIESIKIDQYKASIEGYLASLQWDKTQVELYGVQVTAARTDSEERIAETRVQLEIEKAKADISLSEASTQVQIANAISQSYSAQTTAETAIAKATSDIDVAHTNAATEIEKARAQISVAEMQAKNELNRANTSNYAASIEAEKAKVDLLGAQVSAEKLKVEQYAVEVEAEKAGVDLFIAESNAQKTQVDIYATQVDAEKAKAGLYSAQMAGEQTKVDLYSAQVEAEKAGVEVYRTEVAAETARIGLQSAINDGERNKVELFKAELLGATAEVDLAKAQIDMNKVQADMFSVEAENAKAMTGVYLAQIEGEKAKVDVYASEVNAERANVDSFNAQVNSAAQDLAAQKAKLDAEIATGEFAIKANTQQLEKYKTELARYTTDLEKEKYDHTLTMDSYKINQSARIANAEIRTKNNLVLIEEMKTTVQVSLAQLQASIEEMKMITSGYVAINELKMKGTEGAMMAQTQLAAAALNAANVSASVGRSEGESKAWVDGSETSISESHNYSYEG